MNHYFFPVDYAVLRHTQAGWQIPTRTIENHELVFILEGQMEICLEGKNFCADPGTLLYFHPHCPHSLKTSSEHPAVFCGIHFSPENGQELPLSDVTKWGNFRKFSPILEEIVRLWNRKGYLDDWAADLAFSRLLLELFRETDNAAAPSSRRRIGNAIDYIHQNPDRPVTIAELCEVTGMKKSYLIHNFQLITGQSPIQYSLNLRLDHARAILLNESASIHETAARCGFRDEFYFSRMFRKKFGLPPSQFRQLP
ncbi:MAG: helix-turn-helix domain-containing protein [Candidatus Merdivicinus sp.]